MEAHKTITISVAGVTAAYSLDSTYAEATTENGLVIVSGRIAGATHVMVVTASGAQAFEILVINAPAKPRTDPLNPLNINSGIEDGYSESRYASSPSQFQSTLDLSRRQGDTTTHLHLVGTRQLGSLSSDQDRTALSSASYQISTARRDVTLLDQYVQESPLGIAGSIVRGIHIRQDGWLLHAGYTSVASFEGLFLPTRAEGVVEVGYRRPLTEHSSLTASFNHFSVPSTDMVGRTGSVGVATYDYSSGETLRVSADVGLSRGVGASARLDYRGDRDSVRGSFRYAPSTFASLGANNIKGFHSDLSWTRKLVGKLSSEVTLYSNRLALPGLQQTTMTASAKLQYLIGGHWSVFGGATGSTYKTAIPPRPPVSNVSAPAGLSFSSRHFGAQGQYQFSEVSKQDAGGHQFRASVRGGAGAISVSAFAERQTHAPTLSFLLDQAHGLRQAIELLGIQATTIEQVDSLLRDSAYLFAAGYIQGATVNIAPVRSQVGGTLAWNGRGRKPQVSYNFLYNDNQDLLGSTRSTIHSVVCTQRIGAEELSVSYSAAGMKLPGLTPIYRPVFSVAWRHPLNNVPSFIIPEHHGSISGTVFRDDSSKGAYESGMQGIAGVQLVLDGSRRTRTAADGSFRFLRVPVGKHSVAVSYRTDRPTFFSTQSDVEVAENGTVNFGIGFSLSGLMGRVSNDAGEGVTGVNVAVRSQGGQWMATTNGDGGFFVRQLSEGVYEVEVDADSIPAGYLTAQLEVQRVQVGLAAPGRAEFAVRALRSIGGRVFAFDTAVAKALPVAGKVVTLKGSEKTSTTDAEGRYLFRDLAAGSYTVAVEAGARMVSSTVKLPASPMTLSNIDLQIVDAAPGRVAPTPALKGPVEGPIPASPSPRETISATPKTGAAQPAASQPPPSASAKQHDRLGRQKLASGQYREAIAELGEAIRMEPGFALAYNARGFAWYLLHDLSSATADLDRAIALNPNYANAYRNRAVVRRAAGDLPGAEEDRRREAMLMSEGSDLARKKKKK
ncbi:carboxypeptidase regulatory-like domain-containing protein [Paludibaculum fermentans]|uniref:Carboxypeptidase regulatory-like domain-containing protein n=1 Tax=Paludibaculum fermentans TaxID=1473598 RepID=A0A7S7SJD4_PALFE|nr:carboxypeptidase regulatory-like domain-containing protein [Paludibaculum fermentans]QOY86573.1 carboxypeptidase regulatory-like domain-containing protein [Paludibaculum fermentans]